METNHPDLKCHHDLPPKIYTSNRKYPGREFYRCPKPIGEQCSFFLWVDEAIPSPSRNQALPPTPQSAQASGSTFHEPPSTPTPSSRKRTSPDDMLSSPTLSWQSQKRAKHGDEAEEEHPGSQGPASQSISTSQPSTSDKSNTSTCVPDGPSMSQETVRSEISEEFSADSVARKVQFFNQLPDYIRKLEKRKLAAEMSRDAKARKIVHLEAEVERLKHREKELEELISMLESARE